MSLRIKKNDQVEVITGKYKGTVSRVLYVVPDKDRLAVENVAMVKRHMKPNQRNRQGSIMEREATIHMSNCMLYCDKCKRGVRYGAQSSDNGDKKRVCKRCGSTI